MLGTCQHLMPNARRMLSLPGGMNLNQDLVKQGWCWWYRKYARGDTVLEGLEKAAREAREGLWVDPAHVPPWEWRRHRN